MKEVNSQKVKSILKDLLKKKGMTYEELAKDLGCSVPTVNRILGSEEISLNRILEICEILDLSFSDLGQLMKVETKEVESFTPEQEVFLSKNPHFFAYFMSLMSGDSPKTIAEENKLSARSTDRYLMGLENNGLIHVTGKNRVRPVFKKTPSLGKGPLGRAHFEKLIHAGGKFFIDNIRRGMASAGKDASPSRMILNGSKMTKATYQNFVEEQERLINRFIQISDMEEKIKKPSELMTGVILCGHTLVPNEDPVLKNLNHVFGEIKGI